MVSSELFIQIVQNAPLVAVDLVICGERGTVLLGLRNNEPGRAMWFVPGGCVLKGERVADAFSRILSREVRALAFDFANAKLLGVFEHFHENNFAGQEGIPTHYVVLAYRLQLDRCLPLVPGDAQHDHFKWFTPREAALDDRVDRYTKEYFENGISLGPAGFFNEGRTNNELENADV